MTDLSNRSGGADFNAQEITVGQDVVGRDKIVQQTTNNYYMPQRVVDHDKIVSTNTTTTNNDYDPSIEEFLDRDSECVRIISTDSDMLLLAPPGFGKSRLLEHMEEYFTRLDRTTIWLDFEERSADRAAHDDYWLLGTIATKLGLVEPLPRNNNGLMDVIDSRLASTSVVFLLDNVDLCSKPLLEWIRRELLPQLRRGTAMQVRVLATSRKVIGEWVGYGAGRKFEVLQVQTFDRDTVQDLLNRAIQARDVRHSQILNSTAVLSETAAGLFRTTCGYPLLIMWMVDYAWRQDRLVHSDFFDTHAASLAEHCLAPALQRRLIVADQEVVAAFVSLCVFRHISPSLIENLIEATEPLAGKLWQPLAGSQRSMREWWRLIVSTDLIDDIEYDRRLHRINPVARRIGRELVRLRDENLFRSRNRYASHIYAAYLKSYADDPTTQAQLLIEYLYHESQCITASSGSFSLLLSESVVSFLKETADPSIVARHLKEFAQRDDEFRESVQQASPGAFDMFIATLQPFL